MFAARSFTPSHSEHEQDKIPTEVVHFKNDAMVYNSGFQTFLLRGPLKISAKQKILVCIGIGGPLVVSGADFGNHWFRKRTKKGNAEQEKYCHTNDHQVFPASN